MTTTADAQPTTELSTVLRQMFAQMHFWLDGTMQDVTAECAHWQPGGRAIPAGAHYAHHVMGSEDMIFNGLIRNATPLALGAWQGKTGVSEPHPTPMGAWDAWARRVQIDLQRRQGSPLPNATHAAPGRYDRQRAHDPCARRRRRARRTPRHDFLDTYLHLTLAEHVGASCDGLLILAVRWGLQASNIGSPAASTRSR